ncbi:hypothetical protein U0070_009847, partial [Myodes glareolus]
GRCKATRTGWVCTGAAGACSARRRSWVDTAVLGSVLRSPTLRHSRTSHLSSLGEGPPTVDPRSDLHSFKLMRPGLWDAALEIRCGVLRGPLDTTKDDEAGQRQPLTPTLRTLWWAPLSRKQESPTDTLVQRGHERHLYPAEKLLR